MAFLIYLITYLVYHILEALGFLDLPTFGYYQNHPDTTYTDQGLRLCCPSLFAAADSFPLKQVTANMQTTSPVWLDVWLLLS